MVVAYLKRNRLLDLEKLARGVTISLNTALKLPKTSFDGKSEILTNLGPTLLSVRERLPFVQITKPRRRLCFP